MEAGGGGYTASLRNVEIQVDTHASEAQILPDSGSVIFDAVHITAYDGGLIFVHTRFTITALSRLTTPPTCTCTPPTRLNLYSPDITMSENLRLSTTPVDRRFPNVNQAQHCWYVRSPKQKVCPPPRGPWCASFNPTARAPRHTNTQ